MSLNGHLSLGFCSTAAEYFGVLSSCILDTVKHRLIIRENRFIVTLKNFSMRKLIFLSSLTCLCRVWSWHLVFWSQCIFSGMYTMLSLSRSSSVINELMTPRAHPRNVLTFPYSVPAVQWARSGESPDSLLVYSGPNSSHLNAHGISFRWYGTWLIWTWEDGIIRSWQ